MMSIAELPADVLPTHLDLPCTDGKPVENGFQLLQSVLLLDALVPHLDQMHPDGNYMLASDMGIYWRRTQEPLDGCKAPDWYYVPGVSPQLDGHVRRSYVLWQEKIPPLLVIEYVSGSGAEERDDTPEKGKFWIYEQVIQARYYLIYDFVREELDGFELRHGKYLPIRANGNGRIELPPMKVEFGMWHGKFRNATECWLRVWELNGPLLPTKDELIEAKDELIEMEYKRLKEANTRTEQQGLRAEQENLRAKEAEKRAREEHERAEQERLKAEEADQRAREERERAEQERLRAEKLAARLRELGIDPSAS